jgi:hypothetical protein
MANRHAMKLWALSGLGLVLLVLLPTSASAQRRRFREDVPDDPFCGHVEYGLCQKFRVAVVGGGILSPDTTSIGLGVKAGYSLVVAPRLEIGGSLLYVQDVRFNDQHYLGTAELLLRVATVARRTHRVFLELAGGASRYDSPDIAYWAFPCATGGVSVEVSGPGLGLFATSGLTLMWAEGLAALPHAGVGLVF